MNILFLGPDKQPQNSIINFLLSDGNLVNKYEDTLDVEKVEKYKYDFLISFGYRYIIKDKILTHFKENALNLHISYLPWNRGSDPNLWSILENTPKGVTIHQLENGAEPTIEVDPEDHTNPKMFFEMALREIIDGNMDLEQDIE